MTLPNTRHIVSFSTGVPSAIVAYLICKQYPDAIVVFADVKVEDDDNYRFYRDIENLIGKKIVGLGIDKEPLEIAEDEGFAFIPNHRTATCTRKGKIEPIRDFAQEGDIMYIGMTHEDAKKGRLESPIKHWGNMGVTVKYPLIEQNILDPIAFAKELGLDPPRMYAKGYKHGNCGGCCVKQGRGDWIRTLIHFPDRYNRYENWEHKQRTRQAVRMFFELYRCTLHPMFVAITKISKLYTFVRKVEDGDNIGITLRELRLEYETQNKQPNFFDLVDELNGYGCTVECGIGNEYELSEALS